jgi:two-component system, OmpR family, sensor histidine kinase KdpD
VSPEEAATVPNRFVPLVAILSLLGAFVVDLLTPQLFVAAILLDVPIVLSSLGGSSRFRIGLIIAALFFDAIAGYVNGVHAGFHWDAVGIGDRILAGLSIVFVGYLSSAVSENAERAGRAASQELRARRETQISTAIERVRASLSTELVERAIAHEAVELFDASEVRFNIAGPVTTTLVARRGAEQVDVDEERLSPALISLVQRAADDGDPIDVEPTDALGRLILDTSGGGEMLAIPIADGERRFGVLLVQVSQEGRLAELRPVARAYAQQAANALAQARLFEQLAERNAALEERSGIIRDLVYALSHDLRTPLAALGMTLRQAQAGAYGELPERYHEIVERSVIATDDVQRLAETLLLVARFESGDRRPERDPLDLGEIVRQIAGELEALAAARGVELHVRLEDGPPIRSIGDRSDIRRAITNLVANAIEHTPAEGHVWIAVQHAGNAALVRITDDGFGISEKTRAHLFTRFARGDDRRGGGSGLGLYIVRRVAEESGGSVSYEPNNPQGSIFTLRLPAAPTS